MFRSTLACVALFYFQTAQGVQYKVSPTSKFVVVILKDGIASRFSHNHLIRATQFHSTLDADVLDLNKTRFEITFPVSDLEADNPQDHQEWSPKVQQLGILNGPFVLLSDSDRKKIRTNMLAADQLDAKNHPEINAKLLGVTENTSTMGSQKFSHVLETEIQLHGKTVRAKFPATISSAADKIEVFSVGELITDFSIKPFSAMLGALKNQDRFFLIVDLTATK